jgi:hypothetical protein
VIFGAIAVGMVTEWAGPARHQAARRGRRRHHRLFVLVQAAFVFNYAPSFQLLSVAVHAGGHHHRHRIRDRRPEHAAGADRARRHLPEPADLHRRLRGAGRLRRGGGPVAAEPPHQYPAVAYQVAFGLLVLLQLPGLLKFYRRRRPVECSLPVNLKEDEYEIGALRSSR